MNERAGFLRAIRESPDDLGLRLIFADWLEEQGDPLADFIRRQCAAEPRRADEKRFCGLTVEEGEIVQEHRAEWLGPLADLMEEPWGSPFFFRRGLVEGVALPADTFLDRANEFREWCPVLQEVTLFGVRGSGARLALCPHLEGLPSLRLADWPSEEDAEALAGSAHLAGLRTLTLWLGGRHDDSVCRAFARSGSLAGLRELVLVQLYGGLFPEGEAEELAARADALAGEVNALRGAPLARVERPFLRRFPIREDANGIRGLYAGRLSDGRQALALVERGILVLALFTEDGERVGVERRELSGVLVREPEVSYMDYDQGELLEYLGREFGFRLALIHVKECEIPEADCRIYLLPSSLGLGRVGGVDPLPDEEKATLLYHWLERGDFVIDWGNDFWAGPDGVIHSS
jgi:uncharacterized protein (TIGR02996 family)